MYTRVTQNPGYGGDVGNYLNPKEMSNSDIQVIYPKDQNPVIH